MAHKAASRGSAPMPPIGLPIWRSQGHKMSCLAALLIRASQLVPQRFSHPAGSLFSSLLLFFPASRAHTRFVLRQICRLVFFTLYPTHFDLHKSAVKAVLISSLLALSIVSA